MMKSRNVLDGKATFGEALKANKFRGKRENRLSRDRYAAMFEVHIEQGPYWKKRENRSVLSPVLQAW